MANIASGDGVTLHCEKYLRPNISGFVPHPPTSFEEVLREMLHYCGCGFDGCKHLDFDSTDMSFTCKETKPFICKLWNFSLFEQWKTKPIEADKFCTERYNHYEKLAVSCGWPNLLT